MVAHGVHGASASIANWRVTEFATNDIGDYYGWETATDWRSDCIQLSPGGLGHRVRSATLPNMRINLEATSASLRSRQRFLGDAVVVSLLIAGNQPAIWRGFSLDEAWAFVYDAAEHDFWLPEGSVALTFELSGPLAESAGLDLFAGAPARVRPSRVTELTRAARALFDARSGVTVEAMQRRVVASLSVALIESCGPSSKRRVELVRRSEALLDMLAYEDTPTIGSIAQRLSVSRRTLDRAFESCVNMGGARYLRLVRLHRMRQLLRAAGDDVSVANAALAVGFAHFGKAAKHYRTHFGELPKTTLRNARLRATKRK